MLSNHSGSVPAREQYRFGSVDSLSYSPRTPYSHNMLSKLTSLICVISLVVAAPQQPQPASQFPAGVDPALCPSFPICDNALLHSPQPSPQPTDWNLRAQPAIAAPQQAQWNGQPPVPAQQTQWNNPAPASIPQTQWNSQPTAPPQYNQWNSPAPPAPQPTQWNSPAPIGQQTGQWNSPAPIAPQWQASTVPSQWGAPSTPAPYYPTAPAQNWALSTPAPYYPSQQQPSYNPPSTNDVDSTGGDKYPAGVNPQACPNYPYCDSPILGTGAGNIPAAPQPAPLPGYTERLYPAGVSPQQCPNFPYC